MAMEFNGLFLRRAFLLFSEQQSQAVQHNDDRAPFVSHHSDSQRDPSKQRETDEHCHRAERDEEVLTNHVPRAPAQFKGGDKILQSVVHQHDFGLLQRGVRTARGTRWYASSVANLLSRAQKFANIPCT